MQSKTRGVTLIELMVTVAIVGVLASIAYPSYRAQVMRSNRTEAKGELLKTSQELERCFTSTAVYSGCKANYNTPNAFYSIAITTVASPPSFSATATAIGNQLSDVDCRTFTIDSTNSQSATKSSGAANNVACWK